MFLKHNTLSCWPWAERLEEFAVLRDGADLIAAQAEFLQRRQLGERAFLDHGDVVVVDGQLPKLRRQVEHAGSQRADSVA